MRPFSCGRSLAMLCRRRGASLVAVTDDMFVVTEQRRINVSVVGVLQKKYLHPNLHHFILSSLRQRLHALSFLTSNLLYSVEIRNLTACTANDLFKWCKCHILLYVCWNQTAFFHQNLLLSFFWNEVWKTTTNTPVTCQQTTKKLGILMEWNHLSFIIRPCVVQMTNGGFACGKKKVGRTRTINQTHPSEQCVCEDSCRVTEQPVEVALIVWAGVCVVGAKPNIMKHQDFFFHWQIFARNLPQTHSAQHQTVSRSRTWR